MTTFKEIRGTAIEVLSSDPSNPELGQIWYNSSSGTLKGYVFATVNAWASGGNLSTARNEGGTAGIQTAAIGFGGYVPPNSVTAATESYNGTSWTSGGNLGTARYRMGRAGTQTAALSVGGGPTVASDTTTTQVESYNGSSWSTNPASLNTSRKLLAGFGTQTAAIAAGGYSGPPGIVRNSSESYNGTSWTNTSNLNTARGWFYGAGTQTSGLVVAGYNLSSGTTNVESWNGSAWTNATAYPSSTYFAGVAGESNTSALVFGGSPATTSTQNWNGSAWTSTTGMSNARQAMFNAGTQTLALAAGGWNGGSLIASTEEWTGTVVGTRTITTS